MKNTALKFLCLSLFGASSAWQTPVSAAETIVGYHRLSTTAAEDSLAWTDSSRFSDIVFEESIAAYGAIASASGTTITTSGVLGADDEFVYAAGSQPRHYLVEITSGSAQGDTFDITDSTSNTLTVDLGDGSLSGIAANDTFKIVAKWSLSLLFPDGADLVASTASDTGTEVLIAAADAAFDPSAADRFQYRSDLSRWINVNDTATDVGDNAIAHGSQVVIRQSSDTPITPIFAGTVASTGVNPLKVSINYQEAGLDSFANALDITGSGSKAVDSSAASGEGGEPQHAGIAAAASVWFKYSATENGALLINSKYSDYDTVLAVYTGTALGNLQPVASNDDATDTTSETFFNVTAGQEYYIALDRKSGAGSAGYLNFEMSAGSVDEPAGFNMSAASAEGMNLAWNASGNNADTYRIYRSADGTFAGATMIAEVAGNVSSYQDTTMSDGVSYSYWVEAGNGYIRNLTSSSIMARSRSIRGHVANTSVPSAITIGGVPVSSDFDGNGVDDLLVQNQTSGEIGWWNLNETGEVIGGEVLGLNPGADWQLVNHADLNSDDNPDLLLRSQNSGEVVAWTLNGAELDFASSLALGGSNFGTAADWKVAGAAGASDDAVEIASQNSATGQIAYWEVTSSSSDTPGYDVGLGQLFNTQPNSINWKLVGLRDFNNDGANDLFWQNQSSGTMAVWFLNDDKDLLSAAAISLQTNDPTWEVKGLGDWDGDSKTDISLQNSATGAIVLWYLDGVTYRSSSPVQNPAAGGSWEVRNSDQGQ